MGSGTGTGSPAKYISFGDMFDGGGPGKSGDSYSTKDNSALDTDGDGNISDAETEAGGFGNNLPGGADGSSGSALDFDGDGVGYTGIGDMFDGGGPGMAGDSFSTANNTGMDTDGDGYITSVEAEAATGSANLPGGIDGSAGAFPLFGYDNFTDTINGGGPGNSGDSFSDIDNTGLDLDGDGNISLSETEAGGFGNNLPGGIDGDGPGSPNDPVPLSGPGSAGYIGNGGD